MTDKNSDLPPEYLAATNTLRDVTREYVLVTELQERLSARKRRLEEAVAELYAAHTQRVV